MYPHHWGFLGERLSGAEGAVLTPHGSASGLDPSTCSCPGAASTGPTAPSGSILWHACYSPLSALILSEAL